MAARSPARSSAGPLVMRSADAPSRRRRCPASVVLPRPGGPANSRWSTAWPRCRAAPSRISRCSFSRGWPTNSSSRRGRSVVSSAASTGSAAGAQQLVSHGRSLPARRPGSLSASRSRSSTGAVVGQLAPARRAPRRARSRGRRARPAPRRAARRRRRRRRRGRARARRAAPSARRAAAARCACRRPGTSVSASRSSSSSAAAQRARASAPRGSRAPSFGPTPVAPMSTSNVSRSSRVGKP